MVFVKYFIFCLLLVTIQKFTLLIESPFLLFCYIFQSFSHKTHRSRKLNFLQGASLSMFTKSLQIIITALTNINIYLIVGARVSAVYVNNPLLTQEKNTQQLRAAQNIANQLCIPFQDINLHVDQWKLLKRYICV